MRIVFALVGFLSPSSRGALGTMMIVFHMLFGFVGGYVSTRVYKTFGGEDWKMNIILTPLFVPGIVFATFFVMNFFLIFERSSGAVPFGTMVGLIGLWFVISLPLSFAGSWMGLKKPVSVHLVVVESGLTMCSRFKRPSAQIKFLVRFRISRRTSSRYLHCFSVVPCPSWPS